MKNTKQQFTIEETDRNGRLIATISGIGRNRGTWDSSCHSMSTACRWLREIRAQFSGRHFRISKD